MKDKVCGALYGIMIGDAMGMPVETMTQAKIIESLGTGGVAGFMNPKQTRIDDTKHMVAGDTTDDWQLAKVVLESLIASGGFNAEHMINAHCRALRETKFGWGKGSVHAIQAIIDGTRDGRSPPAKAPGIGLGNGIMMKVAPLALYHALLAQKHGGGAHSQWRTFARDCRALGAITHSDPRAWISAFAVGMMMQPNHTGKQWNADQWMRWAFMIARHVEELEASYVDNPSERVLAELIRNASCAHYSAEEILEKFGSKFTVTETLPFTIATFLKHPNDFRAGVLEAVNAGGDTDTNASIVGAMIGANVGAQNIPEEWRNFRTEYAEAITLGDQLLALTA